MIAKDSLPPTTPENPPLCSTDPLRILGPDALDIHDTPPLAQATLCQLEITSDTARNRVTLLSADDLFQDANDSSDPKPIPQTGTITSAIILLRLITSPTLLTLLIRPPCLLRLDPPGYLSLIEPWLLLRHFISAKNTACGLILLVLAATTLAAAPDDNLFDADDDPDDDTMECTHTPRFRSPASRFTFHTAARRNPVKASPIHSLNHSFAHSL